MQKPQMRLIEIKGDELKEIISGYESELSEICGVEIKLIPKRIIAGNEAIGKDYIIETVCRNYAIPFEMMAETIRKREICEARHALMYFLYKYSNMGTNAIGKLLNRDHSTVIHGKRVYQDYYIQSDHLTKAHNLTIEQLN